MAYAAVVTVPRRGSEILVEIAETDCEATSEATVTLAVNKFKIHRQMCELDSGTGTTIDPIIGNATNPSGAALLLSNGTAAQSVDNSLTGGICCYDADGVLYHRSQPDAGTDNTVTTLYLLTVGW